MTSKKVRLDTLIAERGLAESREKARALIIAGEVTVNGVLAKKPAEAVEAVAEIDRKSTRLNSSH